MMHDYTYAADIAYEDVTKTKSSARSIGKGLKGLIIFVVIIIAAELVWLLVISAFIPFSDIEVHGFTGLERHEILRLCGIDETSSYFSTNINQVREILTTHILVETAVITRRFPDKLSIFLTPRQAAAVSLTKINDKQALLYVDRHGVFYKMEDVNGAPDAAPYDKTIPVISGIENPQVAMRLPDALVPLTQSLSVIAASSPELLAAISEIRIERKPWEGFELVLYPVHSSIKVRVENSLTEDMLRYIFLMLNVFETSNPMQMQRPQEIDFRSGMGSYRVKEQSL